jgi:ubiquinone/menaquinone biosynthesis C-methylase UbiE
VATRFKPHPRFARFWLRMSPRADERGAAEHRRELLAGLTGRVLELGCGNGLNFPHYPREVTEVLAVEPEPTLRAAAEEAAGQAPVPVRVVEAVADELPGENGSFDAAVVSLVLCSVPDQDVALGELRRVVRSGGELRFYEHVIPKHQPKRAMFQFAERTFWPHVSGGCHPARDTGAAIARAGFQVESSRRFGFRASALEPNVPHILGRARRP